MIFTSVSIRVERRKRKDCDLLLLKFIISKTRQIIETAMHALSDNLLREKYHGRDECAERELDADKGCDDEDIDRKNCAHKGPFKF